MKVLVIMGSPRIGATYRAAEEIRGMMQSHGAVEFEYLMLGDKDLAHCRGCFTCFVKGEEHCPIRDDGPAIEQQLHEADGVIFASPVYGMNVTALFKIFVDRFSYIFHRPRFFGKKALLLSTAGAVGLREVLGYMRLVARIWGFDVVAEAGLVTPPGGIPQPPSQQEANARTLQGAAEKFYSALLNPKPSSPGIMDVIIFHAQRASFDELGAYSPVDYAFWKEHGWFGKGVRYYTDAPVNPLYTAIGVIVEWVLRRRTRKMIEAAQENLHAGQGP